MSERGESPRFSRDAKRRIAAKAARRKIATVLPRFFRRKRKTPAFDQNLGFDPKLLPMEDWELLGVRNATVGWRDCCGDVISLSRGATDFVGPSLSDESGLQRHWRKFVEGRGGGLIEVSTTASAEGPCLTVLYKRLEMPAFKFDGILAIPLAQCTWVWMVIAGERGMTGVREAVVTARMLQTGQLTPESYKASWAQDPYDPDYEGVDRRTMRYMSDSAEYDAEFPHHPLTKVRRELLRLAQIRVSRAAVDSSDGRRRTS